MRIILLFMSAFITLVVSSSAESSDKLIDALLDEQDKIRSIDCSLTQLIFEEGSSTRYEGRFRAVSGGRFRIDYYKPSIQTVLNTENGLFWHIPEYNTLYIIPSANPSTGRDGMAGAGNVLKKIHRDMELKYLGIHFRGFFSPVHEFIILDKKNGMKIEIFAGARDNIILEKKIIDRDGNEVMHEVYGNYARVHGVLFPHRVDVFAKTKNGVTRSISEYEGIMLNGKIHESVFRLKVPKNIRKVSYAER